MSAFHGGPPPPPAAVSGVESTLGIYRAEDYGGRASSDDPSGGINLALFVAAAAGGGIVTLDSGLTYTARRTITLQPNVELVIPTGTVVRAGAGLNGDLISGTNLPGVRVSGGGTIDCNRAGGGQAAGNAITLTGCTEPQLEQVSIVNAWQDGVALVNCVRPVLDIFVGATGRHGVYHSGTSFGRGQITARDNGQRVAGSGVVFDAASTDNCYAPLVATDTRVGGAKTQQYGVLEVPASGCDRNTFAAASLAGNAAGTMSLVGAASGFVGGAPTGVAGGALAGNYPNPTLVPVTNANLAADVARANQLVNGGFEVWQRGNGPFAAQSSFNADRWQISIGGTSTLSVSRDSANVDAGSLACAALTYTHNLESFLLQQVGGSSETVIYQARGKTMSLSVRVKCSVANAVRLRISDGLTTTYGAYHSGGGGYETLTVTKAFAANSTGLQAAVSLNASGTFYVDNAMLVPGAVAADYVPLVDADDLARCQRYYEITGVGEGYLAAGLTSGTTGALYAFRWKVKKALTPSITFSNVASFYAMNVNTANIATTNITAFSTSPDGTAVSATVAAGLSATQGMASILSSNAGTIAMEANP